MRMNKRSLNLYIDADLIKMAKDHGLVISKFLENQLKSYFEFIEQRRQQYSPYVKENNTSSIAQSKEHKSNNHNFYSSQHHKKLFYHYYHQIHNLAPYFFSIQIPRHQD